MRASDHVVQFYEAEASLLEAVGDYIGGGLRTGEAAVVIAGAAHRPALEERLEADGLDLAAACGSAEA